jgi:diguanylate cyclase (GGDEF)-like protein
VNATSLKAWTTRVALLELFCLGAAFLVGVLVMLEFDLFRNGFEVEPPEKKIEVDEALLLGLFLSVGLLIFAIRRVREQRYESDLLERAESELRVAEFLAGHDELTGLPNRRQFEERLHAALGRAATLHALLLIDLDRFKEINDGFGHLVGDDVLRVVAQRLRASVSAGDVVARIGGDEFAVLVFEVESDRSVEEIARRLVDAVEGPIVIEGRTYRVGTSIGIARLPEDGSTAEALIGAADAHLYRAKGRPLPAPIEEERA